MYQSMLGNNGESRSCIGCFMVIKQDFFCESDVQRNIENRFCRCRSINPVNYAPTSASFQPTSSRPSLKMDILDRQVLHHSLRTYTLTLMTPHAAATWQCLLPPAAADSSHLSVWEFRGGAFKAATRLSWRRPHFNIHATRLS